MQPLAFIGRGEDWLIIIGIIVILFWGGEKIPGVARSLGRSVSEFKKGAREGAEEEKKAVAPKDAEQKPG